MSCNGNYGYSPSQSGKYFALTYTDVQNFANKPINAEMNLTITTTSVPSSVVDTGYLFNDLGGTGASVFFSDDQLSNVYSTMTPPIILPNK